MAPMARMFNVLNVAEKPSVAREVARILSGGNTNSRPGAYVFFSTLRRGTLSIIYILAKWNENSEIISILMSTISIIGVTKLWPRTEYFL